MDQSAQEASTGLQTLAAAATANELQVAIPGDVGLAERRDSAAPLDQQFSGGEGLSIPAQGLCCPPLNYATGTAGHSGVYASSAHTGDHLGTHLNLNEVGNPSYPNMSTNVAAHHLAKWRPSNQNPDMWQANVVADNEWEGWWQDWTLGSINAPLTSHNQAHF